MFLWLCLALTAIPLAACLIEQRRRRHVLGQMARERGCRFEAHGDPLLAPGILAHLPSLGAADVRLIDLILCDTGSGDTLAVGRLDYQLGSVRTRRDNTRIVLLRRAADGSVHDVTWGDAQESRMAQYRHLLEAMPPAQVTV